MSAIDAATTLHIARSTAVPSHRTSGKPWLHKAAAALLAAGAVFPTTAAAAGNNGTIRREQRPAASNLPLKRLERAFTWGVHADTDIAHNTGGGAESGTAAIALIHAAAAFNLSKINIWPGGRLRLDVEHIGGDDPSNLVGDVQGVSSLSARSATRLFSAYYSHRLGDTGRYRFGLMNLNAWFAVTGAAGALINSSFGITPSLSVAVPTSIYPRTGYGAMVQAKPSRWDLQAGVFQGEPRQRDNPFGHGEMAIAEAGYNAAGPRGGTYKLGVWQYQNGRGQSGAAPSADGGIYGIIVKPISRRAPYRDHRLFLQFGANTGNNDPAPFYLGIGADFFHPFPNRPHDRVSVGMARLWLHSAAAETSYEATYLCQINDWLQVQPDVQYVTNPGGHLDDTTVLMLRLHAEFGD